MVRRDTDPIPRHLQPPELDGIPISYNPESAISHGEISTNDEMSEDDEDASEDVKALRVSSPWNNVMKSAHVSHDNRIA